MQCGPIYSRLERECRLMRPQVALNGWARLQGEDSLTGY